MTDGDSALSGAFPHSITRQSCKSHDLNRMETNAISKTKYNTDIAIHGYTDVPREGELTLGEIEEELQKCRDIVSFN